MAKAASWNRGAGSYPEEIDSLHLAGGDTLELALFASGRPNACAIRTGTKSTAGIYAGLPVAILELTMKAFSHPEFMPWIDQEAGGSSPNFRSDVKFDLFEVLRTDSLATDTSDIEALIDRHKSEIERLFAVLPSHRVAAAVMVQTYAFQYVWKHEIAHVVLGHLHRLEDSQQELCIGEAERSLGDEPDGLRNLFEFEADTIAIAEVVQGPIDRLVAGEDCSESWAPYLRWEDRAIYASLGCIFTMFLFAAMHDLDASGAPSTTHPPPWWRVEFATLISCQAWAEHEQLKGLPERLTAALASMGQLDPSIREAVSKALAPDREEERTRERTPINTAMFLAKTLDLGFFPISYEPRLRLDQEKPLVD